MIGKISKEYLEWIRQQQCVAPLLTRRTCCGKSLPHHVLRRGMDGSKRDDRDVVPLCSMHHNYLHAKDGKLPGLDAKHTIEVLMQHAHICLKHYMDECIEEERQRELLGAYEECVEDMF